MRGVLRTLAFALLAVFIIGPLMQAIVLSLTVTLPHPGVTVGDWSLVNYRNIFDSPALVASLGNSLTYVTANVVLTLIVALPAAYALSRYRFVGDRHVFLLLLAFRITPPVVLSLPIFLLFARLGLLNSPFGIALVHCLFNIPIAIWILESFISAVPREFDETAFLDGNSLSRFFVVHLLPVIAPGVGVACLALYARRALKRQDFHESSVLRLMRSIVATPTLKWRAMARMDWPSLSMALT